MGSSVSCCSTDTVHSWDTASPLSRNRMIGDVPPPPPPTDASNNNNNNRGGFTLSNVVSDGDETASSSATGGVIFNDHHQHNNTNKHHHHHHHCRVVDTGGGSSSTPSLSPRLPLSNTSPNGSFPAVMSGGGDNLECSMPGSVMGSLSINFSITDGGSTNLGDGLLESNHAADSPSNGSTLTARGLHLRSFRGSFSGRGGRRGLVQDPPPDNSPNISTPPPTPTQLFQQVGTTNVNSVALQQQDLEHTHEDFILNNSTSSGASNRAPSLEHIGSSSPLGGSISRRSRRVVRLTTPPPSSPHVTPVVNPLSASASTLNASASAFSTSASALTSLLQLSDTQNNNNINCNSDVVDEANSVSVSEQNPRSQPSNLKPLQLHGGSISQFGVSHSSAAAAASNSHLHVETHSLNTTPNQSFSSTTTTTAPLTGSLCSSFNNNNNNVVTPATQTTCRNHSIPLGNSGLGALSGSQSQMAGTPKNTTVVPPSIRDFLGSGRSKSNSRCGLSGLGMGGSGGGGLESIVTPLNASDSEAYLARSRRISHGGVGPHIEVSPVVETNTITSLSEHQQHLANLPAIRTRRTDSNRLWTPLSAHDSSGKGGRINQEEVVPLMGSFRGAGGGGHHHRSVSSSYPQSSGSSHQHHLHQLQNNNSQSQNQQHKSCNSNDVSMMVNELPLGPDAFQGGSSPESGSSSSFLCSKSMSYGAESSTTPRGHSRRFQQKAYESNCSSSAFGITPPTRTGTSGSAQSNSHSYASGVGAHQHHLDSLLFPDQLISSMSQAPPPHQLQGIFNCSRSEYHHQSGHQRTNSNSQSQASPLPSPVMGTSPTYQPQPQQPTPRQIAQRSIRGAFEVDGRDKRLLRN